MPKALLIDDEVALTAIIARFLQSDGFEVETAISGAEGIRKAIASAPDVIVADVMMPEMDGYEVCRRLRRDPRTTRAAIVILTARGQAIDREIALRAGADAHMSKPYQGKLLVEEIRRLLAARPEIGPPLGQQILVLHLRENAGATTVAANLALALDPGRQLVAAVDLEFGGGQIETQLGLPPTRTWLPDMATVPDQLARGLARHASGAFVLPAPPLNAQPPQPSEIKEILSQLRAWHDFVVIDTALNLGALAPLLFASSPLILLVLAPDATVLRMAQASVAAIRKVGPRGLQVWPVINQVRLGQEGFRQQVEMALKVPVVASLPWAPAECAEALASGRPVVLGRPTSPLGAGLGELARRVAQATTDQPLRRIPR